MKDGGLPFLSGLGSRPVIATPARSAVATAPARTPVTATAPFTTTTPTWLKAWQMPPRPKLPEEELEEVYLKGSGPGGQKIVRFATFSTFPVFPSSCRFYLLSPAFSSPLFLPKFALS